MASVSVFENFSLKGFLLLGLPYELGWISSELVTSVGLGSRSCAVCFGLIVLPRNFSPDGDLGGVYPLGDI